MADEFGEMRSGLGESFSDRRDAARKSLLLISFVVIVIDRGKLAPTRVSIGGVAATDVDPDQVLLWLRVGIAYFLASFLLESARESMLTKAVELESRETPGAEPVAAAAPAS